MRSDRWQMRSRPGAVMNRPNSHALNMAMNRPCAVFRYVGPALPEDQANDLIGPHLFREP